MSSHAKRAAVSICLATACITAVAGCSSSSDGTDAAAHGPQATSVAPSGGAVAQDDKGKAGKDVKHSAPPLKKTKPTVRGNPDDASHADKKAAYEGSPSGSGLTKFDKKNKSYNKKTADVTPKSMPANRLMIPAIGLYKSIIPEGTTKGFADVPPQSWRVGWGNYSVPLSGKHGTTVLNGHVGYNGVPGAFYHLNELKGKKNVYAYTTDSKGHMQAWVLKKTGLYPKGHLPAIYASGKRYLDLNTCGGNLKKMPTVDGTKKLLHAKNFQAVFVPA